MTLTTQQITDCRRFMGYSVSGNSAAQPFRELVYSSATYYGSLSLDYRLANLQPEEENTLTTVYLPNLLLREAEIQGAAQLLDTEKAAIFTRNPREVNDRISLFNYLRRQLCEFLGFSPGPLLGTGGRVVRA